MGTEQSTSIPRSRAVGGVVLLVALAAAGVNQAGAGRAAGDILQRSGVQGGLIVHVGCGDGRLTAALHGGESYLVHGLEKDASQREQARAGVRSAGLYGPVSVAAWDGARLPYADNLVNLVVSDTDALRRHGVTMAEVMRVLAPRGVAMLKQDGGWTKSVKPWPDEIDEWTHYLHGPSNNAVADDAVVGPPRRLQWAAPPPWSASHDHLANLSAAVTGGGRIFYILDQSPAADITMPPEWTLIARDAFDGSHVGLGGANYRLFVRNLEADPRRTPEAEVSPWERSVELLVRAMIQAAGRCSLPARAVMPRIRLLPGKGGPGGCSVPFPPRRASNWPSIRSTPPRCSTV